MISDTVGFIRKLPHQLVEAFKSTLEEAAYSDVIVKVADAADEEREDQLTITDQVLAELGEHIPAEDIHDEPDLAEAARKAVALVRAGEADFLMKGKLDTSVLLKAVVNKETGLGKGGVMSHFTAFEIPTYHKLLMPVDGGMVTYPTLEQKKAIIENTVGALRAMGYDCPKVGVLACVEKLNPKMPETVEGDALKQMNQRGELTGCVVEGPISYDCAVSREIAAFKGFESPCAGDCDVLVAPNIHAGNIMGKMLTVTCKAKMAGSSWAPSVPSS